ncbi:hypothetical protein BDY19DRAFT_905934 [Irpex rosettiformis]|uniref:Uncharacterized protein n=1 Tax=Irpex rosettiformis TaxID=378272 RepID=A0ACB8U5J0_9APHY|nr:hypothetical protein BDY19DRAFT_905934 [Irpex rosettiformis]
MVNLLQTLSVRVTTTGRVLLTVKSLCVAILDSGAGSRLTNLHKGLTRHRDGKRAQKRSQETGQRIHNRRAEPLHYRARFDGGQIGNLEFKPMPTSFVQPPSVLPEEAQGFFPHSALVLAGMKTRKHAIDESNREEKQGFVDGITTRRILGVGSCRGVEMKTRTLAMGNPGVVAGKTMDL